RKTTRKRRKCVDQNAPSEHSPPTQTVCQITAQQAEDSPGECWHEKQQAAPQGEICCTGLESKLNQRRPQNQRQHQQFIRVEREADDLDDSDEPLDEREAGRGGYVRIHLGSWREAAGGGGTVGMSSGTTFLPVATDSINAQELS